MTLQKETEALRERLRQWAAAPEWSLLVRYELLPQSPSPVWHKRLSQRAGRLLRVLGLSRERYCRQPWQPGLKHAATMPGCKILLVWSDISEASAQRVACRSLQQQLVLHPGLCSVLVTEVADFAFYSRLGWLVEYLPELSGNGPCYRERKQRYLAWRYRDAIVVPLSVVTCDEPGFSSFVHPGK